MACLCSSTFVIIIRSTIGVILGAKSYHNEYDGHMLEALLEQIEHPTQRRSKQFSQKEAIEEERGQRHSDFNTR